MSAQAAPRRHPLVAALYHGLGSHRDAVLQAPTGTGKSTLVPLALLQDPATAGRKVLMLEPRRLAARALAARMAALLGEPVGASVGYRMRLDTRVSAATRLEVITEGVLTRLLQDDPALEGVAWLLFDEYHERSLQADLGLALALDARRELGADFRVLIMSATLEAQRVAALLDDAALVSVPGSAFEVQIRYLSRGAPLLPADGAEAAALARAVAGAIGRALAESAGDVLVFLPGAGEIRRVQQLLQAAAPAAALPPAVGTLPPTVRVLTLYGQLSAEAQDAALAPAPAGSRNVVLATNVAETSLTLPGVTAVVDSGLARRSRFDPATGMSALQLARISRASSEQRAGRAGRVAPGICYRLWSEGTQAGLAAASAPEIIEADLAPLALELARWGVVDASQLRWLDPPPPAALAQARELLRRLEALDEHGRLTVRGHAMARLAAHPRLAHMLLAADALGCLPLAAQLAALLSERDLMRRNNDGAGRDPDLRTRLELLQAPASARLQRSARALEAAVRAAPVAPGASASASASASAGASDGDGDGRGSDTATAIAATIRLAGSDLPGALLALAFPDRIGCRRDGSGGRYLLANGRGAAFAAPVSLAREPLIVAVGLDQREREARIDLAVPVSAGALEALLAPQIVSEERFEWDEASAALLARQVRRLGAIVLEERLLPVVGDERAVPAMLDAVRRLGIDALPWDAESRSLQARLQFVRSLGRPELAGWPASDDAALLDELPRWLAPYLGGITRRAALARVPLAEALLARLSGAQRRALETLAPRALTVPGGASVRVDYLDEQAPCLAVRLQEVFGLAEAPRIGGGAVPVTLKLLSPARRPVQITRDLAGFWRGSYAQVRKDLRGRYPRHDWPEDPLRAIPSRGSRRTGPKDSATGPRGPAGNPKRPV